MKNLIVIIITIVMTITFTKAQISNKQNSTTQNQNLSDKFSKSSIKALSPDFEYFSNQKTSQVTYTLDLGTYGVYDLLLTEKDLISESLRNSNKNKQYAFNYHGTIKDKPESVVTLTVNKNYLGGFVNTGERTIYFEPNYFTNSTAKQSELIIYDGNDVITKGNSCPVNNHHIKTQSEKIEQQYKSLKNAKMACNSYTAEIVLATTYDMYEKFGDRLESHLETILNGVNANFEFAFNDPVKFKIVKYYIPASNENDSWSYDVNGKITKGSDLLTKFIDHMVNEADVDIVSYDLATLWTYRDLWRRNEEGRIVKLGGIAKNGGLCLKSSKFNIVNGMLDESLSIIAQSHEIAHNFGATHDDCGTKIMTESITPFGGWSRRSIAEINDFYPTASCLCSEAQFIDLAGYENEDQNITCDSDDDLKVLLINKGNINSGLFSVGLYLSEDNIITTDDILVLNLNLTSGLEYGPYYTIDFDDEKFDEKLNELNIASGQYYKGYIIDPDNSVDELIESNNVACVTSIDIETNQTETDENLALQWINPTCDNNNHTVSLNVANDYDTDQIFKITVHNGLRLIHGSHNYTVKKNGNENISLSGIPIGRYQIKVEQKSGNDFIVLETRDYNFKPCGPDGSEMPEEVSWIKIQPPSTFQSACDNNNKRSVAATVTNIHENVRFYNMAVYDKEGLVHASQKYRLPSNTTKDIWLRGIPTGQFQILIESEGIEPFEIPNNITLPIDTPEEDKKFSFAIKSCSDDSIVDRYENIATGCNVDNNKGTISIDVTNGSTQSQFYSLTISTVTGQFIHGSQDYFIPTKEKINMQLSGIPFGTYNVNVLSDCEDLFTVEKTFETCNSARIATNLTELTHYNYPNPFNGNTTITFNTPTENEVSIYIYNTLGEKVATLLEHIKYPQGKNSVNFNATNLPQGIYSYSIQSGGKTYSNKMILLK